jgi:hypothetical protein
LCREQFPDAEITIEHVIPRWMQKKFNLLDERYVLDNRTTIPFRQFRLPFCSECNGVHLSRLENEFQRTIWHNKIPANQLPEDVILQWAAKALYFMTFKESTLPGDFRNPSAGNEQVTAILNGLSDLVDIIADHGRKQDHSRRATVFRLTAQFEHGQETSDAFDILTDARARSIAVRIRSRAFIVVFDGGTHAGFRQSVEREYADHALSPGEFRDVADAAFRRVRFSEPLRMRPPNGRVLVAANHNSQPDLFSQKRA